MKVPAFAVDAMDICARPRGLPHVALPAVTTKPPLDGPERVVAPPVVTRDTAVRCRPIWTPPGVLAKTPTDVPVPNAAVKQTPIQNAVPPRQATEDISRSATSAIRAQVKPTQSVVDRELSCELSRELTTHKLNTQLNSQRACGWKDRPF